MSSQNSGALFIAGWVTGGLVGAGLALLLAPRSGAATRGRIGRKGSLELTGRTGERLAEPDHRAQAQIAAWQEALQKGRHTATEAMSHGMNNATHL
jgi:gas vesicle protein